MMTEESLHIVNMRNERINRICHIIPHSGVRTDSTTTRQMLQVEFARWEPHSKKGKDLPSQWCVGGDDRVRFHDLFYIFMHIFATFSVGNVGEWHFYYEKPMKDFH